MRKVANFIRTIFSAAAEELSDKAVKGCLGL